MLPGAVPAPRGHSFTFLPEYIRRSLSLPQMDLEYTFWQMFYLCFNPSRVYRITAWRKQTKNHWARDDPAFVAIMVFFLSIASLAYAVAFKVSGFLAVVKLMFWTVFIDFISIGVLIASIGWWVSNKFLRQRSASFNPDQTVEWLYAFDVHCNSFFPVFILLYVVQFFLMPLLLSSRFIATFFANTIYLVSFAFYYHITFLGYHKVFLYPLGIMLIIYIFCLIFNVNAAIFIVNTYFYRL